MVGKSELSFWNKLRFKLHAALVRFAYKAQWVLWWLYLIVQFVLIVQSVSVTLVHCVFSCMAVQLAINLLSALHKYNKSKVKQTFVLLYAL